MAAAACSLLSKWSVASCITLASTPACTEQHHVLHCQLHVRTADHNCMWQLGRASRRSHLLQQEGRPVDRRWDSQISGLRLLHISGHRRRSAPAPGLQLLPEQKLRLPDALTGQHGTPQPPLLAQILPQFPGELHGIMNAIMTRQPALHQGLQRCVLGLYKPPPALPLEAVGHTLEG